MQHISIPSNPILNGSVAALLTFAAAFDTSGINSGVKQCTIRADANNPVLLEFFAEIITAFDAATTNRLSIGSSQALADEFLGAADITEGTAGFYPANNANKKYRITADTDIWIRSNGGVLATGTITSDNTAPADGATVVLIDPVTGITETYTFKTTLSTSPAVQGEVLINTTADAALLNLIRAINHTGTAGTDYTKTAASKIVTAAASVTSHAFAVSAIWGGTNGNLIQTPVPSTSPASHMTWGGSVLSGGTNGSITAGNALLYMRVNPMYPSPSQKGQALPFA